MIESAGVIRLPNNRTVLTPTLVLNQVEMSLPAGTSYINFTPFFLEEFQKLSGRIFYFTGLIMRSLAVVATLSLPSEL